MTATPIAGQSHHAVIEYGAPGAQVKQGLMLPDPKQFTRQPYTPFAPASRQGNATDKDFNVTAVWEQFADLSSGAGHIQEKEVEPTYYQFSQGLDLTGTATIGPTLFSAKKGALLPPAAETGAGSIANFKQFCQHAGAWYGLTSDNPGKVYKCDSPGGATWTLSLTLTTEGTQLYSDGEFLHVTQAVATITGATFTASATSNANGGTTDWSNHANALDADADAATSGLNNSTSYYLQLTNASSALSAIPNSAAVRGVVLNLHAWQSGGASTILDAAIKMIKAGTVGTTNRADTDNNWAGSDTVKSYGSACDDWDGSLTGSTVKATNWGFAISCVSPSAATASIHYATADVSYQPKAKKTQDGVTWVTDSWAADFIALREAGNWARMVGANLYPGKDSTGGVTYTSPIQIGYKATNPTSFIWALGHLWIGKPEGLFYWSEGVVTRAVDTSTLSDTGNFKILLEHRSLLYYNVRNRLYFTNGEKETEVVPEDIGGFTALDCAVSTPGPLLVGLRSTIGSAARAYLCAFWGADNPGMHPLWSDADGTRPVVAVGATDIFASPAQRVYFSQTTTGCVYLDMNQRFYPNTYHTKGTTASYIDLVEFSAGFRTIPKWFYEVVVSCRNPTTNTKCIVQYSVDGGAWTATTNEAGADYTIAAPMSLSTRSVGCYLATLSSSQVGCVKNGSFIQLRIYLWTTNASTVAEISHVTVRGAVMVKPRFQLRLPVRCDDEIKPMQGTVPDKGITVLSALRTAAAQGYPFKLQDLDGDWHLVLCRDSGSLETIFEIKEPVNGGDLQTYKYVMLDLIEVDALSATGALNAWSAG